MNSDSKNQLFDIFKSRNLLSPSMQKIILGFMERWGVNAFRAMIETNVIEESRMADVLSEVLKLPRLHGLLNLTVAPEVFALVPYNFALELAVFPFDLTNGDTRISVVFADPSDSQKIQKVGAVSGKDVEPFVGEKTEIIAAIQRHYPLALQLPSLLSRREEIEEGRQ